MGKKHKAAKNKTSKKTVAKSNVKKIVSAMKQKVKAALMPKTERVEVNIVTKALGKAPEQYHFVLHDGRKLKSLYELVDELETMSEDAFKEYVGDFRNDFANWTRDVFQAPDLAEELARLRNKFETQKAVMKHLLRDAQKVASHAVEDLKKAQHEHTKGGKCVIK